MRFFGLLFASLASICFAQTAPNYINVPNGGFDVVAGQPITITWSNPTSGTVTIRLTQGSNLAPGSGEALATVQASAEIATFTVPEDVNTGSYNFAIVDDTDPSNINFSSPFTISGATAAVSASTASATASASASASSLSESASSASASASASASSASESASSSASSASRSASSSASRASSSATAAATSVAASTGDGIVVGISGAVVMLAGAIAVF